jgi:cupin superfamily acireductone dioxygenase involved in methionine salvage
VHPKYRALGVDAMMYCEVSRIARERGFQHIDIVQTNEQNIKMMQELENIGAELYKMHRIYEREL